jgi:hypothetical protein
MDKQIRTNCKSHMLTIILFKRQPVFYLILTFIMAEQIQHLHVTYNDIHDLIRQSTPQIAREFNPDLLIAIGLFEFQSIPKQY